MQAAAVHQGCFQMACFDQKKMKNFTSLLHVHELLLQAVQLAQATATVLTEMASCSTRTPQPMQISCCEPLANNWKPQWGFSDVTGTLLSNR